MCIRVRTRADAKQGKTKSARSKPSKKGGFFAGLKADAPQTVQQSIPSVSYTHLDVYKRQRQGVELLPTVHEGATVRAMEKKGIRTEKGEFNRWIRATNAEMCIRDRHGAHRASP